MPGIRENESLTLSSIRSGERFSRYAKTTPSIYLRLAYFTTRKCARTLRRIRISFPPADHYYYYYNRHRLNRQAHLTGSRSGVRSLFVQLYYYYACDTCRLSIGFGRPFVVPGKAIISPRREPNGERGSIFYSYTGREPSSSRLSTYIHSPNETGRARRPGGTRIRLRRATRRE